MLICLVRRRTCCGSLPVLALVVRVSKPKCLALGHRWVNKWEVRLGDTYGTVETVEIAIS